MNDDRLSAPTNFSIERDYVQKLDFEDIIADFASAKARKVEFGDQGRLVMKAKKAAAYPASFVCFYYFYY